MNTDEGIGMDGAMYRYEPGGRLYSRTELQIDVEAEAVVLPPEQWFSGKFEFAEWLSDSIATGDVEKVFAEG